jgi:hypothetical protein
LKLIRTVFAIDEQSDNACMSHVSFLSVPLSKPRS